MGIETLEVWQLGMELVDVIYDLTSCFPREESYVLLPQMRRAALSIPSNLAEGRARNSRREYARFVSCAQGSTAELWTELKVAQRRHYVADTIHVIDLLDHVSRKLNRLRNSLIVRTRTPNSEPRTPQND
ncbi:MAG TPA: four helix bundle protein [Thermoanaerobaculia bacterium]